MKITDLGKAKKILIEKENNTTIVEAAPARRPDIQGRCGQIRAQIEETTS